MAYTPQQKGVVERKNRTVVEIAKAMLHEKELLYYLWVKAVHTIVYILNKCPTKALEDKTPFEAYSERKPGVAHLKFFGCMCFGCTNAVFIGYATCEKWYKVYDPMTRKLLLSRDIVFDENVAWNWKEMTEKQVSVINYEEQFKSSKVASRKTPLEEQDQTQPSRVSNSYEKPSDRSITMRDAQAFDHTALKWRKLNDVLPQCNLCIVELERFDEATKDES